MQQTIHTRNCRDQHPEVCAMFHCVHYDYESYISRWLLLVSVILQISNFETILYLGHFFVHPV